MKDDTIKRSDAIKVISIPCGTCLARDSKDCEKCSVPKLSKLINAIPSADRPQEWIPCSERLPEADGLYLATFTLIGIPKFSNVESFKNGKWEYHNGYIIAWMPLPKPWKGADDE